MAGNADNYRKVLATFDTAIKARKSKSVTNDLLTKWSNTAKGFTTEFPASTYVLPTPPVIEPPVEPPGPSGGEHVFVPRGASLQDALNAARPGTTLLLDPDATYNAFTIPVKETAAPVHIRPKLDVPAGRVDPAKMPFPLPRIVGNGNYIQTAPRAHDVIITGVEIAPPSGVTAISIGTASESTLEELADNITLNHIWIHCDPNLGGHRGVAANGKRMAILNSRIEGFWQVGRDSQAVAMWNSPGPLLIENCFLEASGENVMLGGSDSRIPGVRPGGLILRRSHLYKPLAWKTRTGITKNLFELKNCKGATIEFSTFENNWKDAQSGNAIVLTPRNQGGTRSDSTVADVLFQYNVVKNVEGHVFNLLGWDDIHDMDTQGANVTIAHNLILNSTSLAQVIQGWNGLRIVHNTVRGLAHRILNLSASEMTAGRILRQLLRETDYSLSDLETIMAQLEQQVERAAQIPGDGPSPEKAVAPKYLLKGLDVSSNVVQSGSYGIAGPMTSVGTPALDYYAPGYVFAKNGIEKSSARSIPYPTGNIVIAAGTYDSYFNADHTVKAGSGFDVLGTDNKKIGADLAILKNAGMTW